MKSTARTYTITDAKHSLNVEDILNSIRELKGKTIKNCRIYVEIPGGGDWSNTQLEIDDETPLIVEVSYEEPAYSQEEIKEVLNTIATSHEHAH